MRESRGGPCIPVADDQAAGEVTGVCRSRDRLIRVADLSRRAAAGHATMADVADVAIGLGWDAVVVDVAGPAGVHTVRSRGLAHPPSTSRDGLARLARQALRTGTRLQVDDEPVGTGDVEVVGSAVAIPLQGATRPIGALACGNRTHLPESSTVAATDLLARVAERVASHAEAVADQRPGRGADSSRPRDFAATLSHELRTPVTITAGLADTLGTRWDQLPGHRRRELVDRLSANARALREVVDVLLDLGRLQAGALRASPDVVDLGALARRVVGRLDSMLEAHPTDVHVRGPTAVAGDERLLDRVLENLLTNVTRHTPPGTTVRIDVVTDAGCVRVSIADDGPGMDEATLARLGSRLTAADTDTRGTRGLGLGLCLASEIVQAHGGELRAHCAPSAGTTLWFELPPASPEVIAPRS